MSANPSPSPIGIFDSGVGGLTVLKSIRQELPQYDYIYLGDNARAPYGTRSFDVIYQYTLEAVKKLFSMGCHLVILACNTASAKALRTIQQNDLPNIDPNKRVLGVIRPTTENIHLFTQSKHIGILATQGTVKSESYVIEINKFSPEIKVSQEACPMWVPLIESNEYQTEGAAYFIQKHIDNIFQKDPLIDTLVLGCTHYPILINEIKKYIPSHVNILSQGEIVAEQLKRYLVRHPEMDIRCSKGGNIAYFTTEDPTAFEEKAGIFLEEKISVKHLELG
jgi:glutamate racemase